MINTTAYAYASVAYPNDVEKIISLFEGVVGVGNASGPILGALVYKALGFEIVFYIFGAFLLPIALLIFCCLPDSKHKQENIAENITTSKDLLFLDQTETETKDGEIFVKLSYRKLICCPRVVFAA
jgi:MFS family permease